MFGLDIAFGIDGRVGRIGFAAVGADLLNLVIIGFLRAFGTEFQKSRFVLEQAGHFVVTVSDIVGRAVGISGMFFGAPFSQCHQSSVAFVLIPTNPFQFAIVHTPFFGTIRATAALVI